MAIITSGNVYSEDDQLTHTNLNAMFSGAAFHADAVDNVTVELSSLKLQVKGASIDTAQLKDGGVLLAKMGANSVDSDQYVDGSIDEIHLSDNSVDSRAYVDGSIDAAHLGPTAIGGQTEFTVTPDDADELLYSDGGVIKKIGIDTFFRHPSVPKAYGIVTWTPSTTEHLSHYNVASVAEPSTHSRQVNFSTNMAGTNYVVVLTPFDPREDYANTAPYVYSRAADHFIIEWSIAEATNREISFAVFGLLAS